VRTLHRQPELKCNRLPTEKLDEDVTLMHFGLISNNDRNQVDLILVSAPLHFGKLPKGLFGKD